jgi:hypothetical protein
MVEIPGVAGADDKDVFRVWNAVDAVVDHGLVAIEGEAVVHVAFDVSGNELHVGCLLLNFAGERSGRVVHVELFAIEAEEKDEGREDGKQGYIAYLRDTPATDDEEDDGSEGDGRGSRDEQPLRGGYEGFVLHVLGSEGENEDK